MQPPRFQSLQALPTQLFAPAVIGVMWALAFPSASVSGLAWAVPGALLALAIVRPEARFRSFYAAGLAYSLTSLYWLLLMPFPAGAIAGWLALSGYCALYPTAWGMIVWRVSPFATLPTSTGPVARLSEMSRSPWILRHAWIVFAACTWVSLEWLISRLLTGFPWNPLGVSQIKLLPLVQIASVTGVVGVSFILVCASLSFVFAVGSMIRTPSQPWIWLREIPIPLLLVGGSWFWGIGHLQDLPRDGKPLRIALVQPSIPQLLIWDDSPESRREKIEKVMELSRQALAENPDLLVWPESATPSLSAADFRAMVSMIRENDCWFVFGTPDSADHADGTTSWYNAAFIMAPSGQVMDYYWKRRLVIFGEYVPLARWLPFLKHLTPIGDGFSAGEKRGILSMGDAGPSFGTLICFEDVFADVSRDHATPEASFLLNITNDGWFGESAAQWQHAQIAAFRSIENAIPLVRCANNGITCVIGADGRMQGLDEGPGPYEAGYRVVEVPVGGSRVSTFYNRHGDILAHLCSLITFVTIAAVEMRRKQLATPKP